MKFIVQFLRILSLLLQLIPRRVQMHLGWILGVFLYLISYRRGIIENNLKYYFSKYNIIFEKKVMNVQEDKSLKSKNKLIFSFYLHFGNLILEILLLLTGLKGFTKKYCQLKGLENIEKALQAGKGAFFLSSHLGNWEIMAAISYLIPIHTLLVTKKLKPPELHKLIEKNRQNCNVFGTYEPKTMRDILNYLKRERTVVGIVLDQYAGPPVGVKVPFFGVDVGTHSILAILAKRTGAPVIPVKNTRQRDGSFVIEFFEPIMQSDDEITLLTARYSSIIEEWIRQTPEQWLWTHHRFKGL